MRGDEQEIVSEIRALDDLSSRINKLCLQIHECMAEAKERDFAMLVEFIPSLNDSALGKGDPAIRYFTDFISDDPSLWIRLYEPGDK